MLFTRLLFCNSLTKFWFKKKYISDKSNCENANWTITGIMFGFYSCGFYAIKQLNLLLYGYCTVNTCVLLVNWRSMACSSRQSRRNEISRSAGLPMLVVLLLSAGSSVPNGSEAPGLEGMEVSPASSGSPLCLPKRWADLHTGQGHGIMRGI